jgi:hypothetical protein
MTFQLLINSEDEKMFGPCTCCGNMTRRVWGYVMDDETTIAAYFVEWTPGHSDQTANFDLILGQWGSGDAAAAAAARKAVSLDFRHLETGPWFRVINAGDRPVSASPLVGEALTREQVIDEPISQTVFAICDIIFLDDPRIEPLRERIH